MGIKEILNALEGENPAGKENPPTDEQETLKAEARQARVSECFETVILPEIYGVERDLQERKLWYKLDVEQLTQALSGHKTIRGVSFLFYPETYQTAYYSQRIIDASYKAFFTSSGDSRKITFKSQFPRRLPNAVEVEERTHNLEAVDKQKVNAFLERFILGAIDAYQSDRLL